MSGVGSRKYFKILLDKHSDLWYKGFTMRIALVIVLAASAIVAVLVWMARIFEKSVRPKF